MNNIINSKHLGKVAYYGIFIWILICSFLKINDAIFMIVTIIFFIGIMVITYLKNKKGEKNKKG